MKGGTLLKTKTYDVVYVLDKKLHKITCSCNSLQEHMNTFIEQNGELFCIMVHSATSKKRNKIKN